MEEQSKTEFSKGEQSANKILEWEQKGGLEGYLKSISKDRAISFLMQFIGRIYNINPQRASKIRNKYMEIINNHTYSNENFLQQEVLSHNIMNWYKQNKIAIFTGNENNWTSSPLGEAIWRKKRR
jgi:hypothetical protein